MYSPLRLQCLSQEFLPGIATNKIVFVVWCYISNSSSNVQQARLYHKSKHVSFTPQRPLFERQTKELVKVMVIDKVLPEALCGWHLIYLEEGWRGVGLFLFSRLLNILNNGQRSDETILHGGLLRSK